MWPVADDELHYRMYVGVVNDGVYLLCKFVVVAGYYYEMKHVALRFSGMTNPIN